MIAKRIITESCPWRYYNYPDGIKIAGDSYPEMWEVILNGVNNPVVFLKE